MCICEQADEYLYIHAYSQQDLEFQMIQTPGVLKNTISGKGLRFHSGLRKGL